MWVKIKTKNLQYYYIGYKIFGSDIEQMANVQDNKYT